MNPDSILLRNAPDGAPPDLSHRGFKLVFDPLPHRRYKAAMYDAAELHVRRRTYGTGGGLLVLGLSGAGKSTVMESYLGNFPREYETERTRVPVLAASVPSSPTARGVGDAIINALGRRRPHRGSAGDKQELLIDLFKKCGVEMLLLDEFHHLLYAANLNHFREVTDWLKLLFDKTKVGVMGAGLPEAELVADSNPQFRRRFSKRIKLSPFAFDHEEDFQEFRAILKAFQRCLPLPCAMPLHEANLARRFHVGSYGLLDYVVKILEGAVSAGAAAGIDLLDLPMFAAGFRNTVWHDVPDRLNPFHPESQLRPLDRSGEVFHQYTVPDVIGSPVVRRLGLNLVRGGK